jgi:hypothetical protein
MAPLPYSDERDGLSDFAAEAGSLRVAERQAG